jgi:O-antigen/teichoic acid export membrane protein
MIGRLPAFVDDIRCMATRLKGMATALRKERFGRLCALADQAFQGVGSLASTALLGRSLALHEFGAMGIAIGAYYFAAGFHRSAVVLPYITEHRPPGDRESDRAYHSDWWWLSVAGSIVLAAALVLIAALLPLVSAELQWLVKPLMLGGVITLPLAAAEFGRRWLYKLGRADLAALASAAFFVTLVAGSLLVARLNPTAPSGLAAWFVAGSAATGVALLAGRLRKPRWQASLTALKPHRGFATWLSLNVIPYTVYSTATVVILVGALFGPHAAALFTAARTLTNPAVSITSAIDSIDKRRAARSLAQDGVPGLKRTVVSTRMLIIALTGVYLAVIAIGAGPILALVFKGQYAGVEPEVRLLCLAFFLFCLNQPSETFLIVLRKSETLFFTRLATAIVTLIALAIALPYGAPGMAMAIAASQIANLALLLLAERRAVALRPMPG